MHSAGAAALIPDDSVRLMENMVSRPGGFYKRPPYTFDDLGVLNTFPTGLGVWDDNANKVQRLFATVQAGGGGGLSLYVKGTSGETWSSEYSSAIGVLNYLASYTTYRGVLYITLASDGAVAVVPDAIASFNGTTLKANPIGGEPLYALTVNSFVDRLILGYVRASVVNQLGTSVAYDPTAWTATNVTTTNITNGDTVTGRITPTNTGTASIRKTDVYTVAASTTDTTLVFRSDLRNQSPTYEMPMTLEVYYSQAWVADTVMAVGAIRVPTTLNGYRYRVTAIAGDFKTDAATEPVWPTVVGTTIVDDQVTWICDGKEQVASQGMTLPTMTQEAGFIPYWVRAVIPPNPASTKVGVRLKFGNAAVGTIELAPVDISLKDGLADGDTRKVNYGQQLTVGKFFYPFVNLEDTATATADLDNDIYWTETSDPNTILGSNYYFLRDAPGKMTGAAVVGGRYVAFKRRGMWVFQGTADPDNPLQLERYFDNVGCVSPRAVCVFEDALYFMGESEIYSYKPGGVPEPICGVGMREEIIANDTAFSGFTGIGFNPTNRDLFVRARPSTSGAIYVYNLDRKHWSKWTTAISPASTIGSFVWCASTGNTYCIIRKGLAPAIYGVYRVDDDATGQDNAGATAVASYITLRPVETLIPRREFSIDNVGVYHSVSGAQTNNTFEVQISLDGGDTFAKYNRVTIPAVTTASEGDRFEVPMRQLSQRAIVRLYHTGDAGKTMFNVLDVDAVVRDIGQQRNISNPTQGASSL
jgi:hypothetical protein